MNTLLCVLDSSSREKREKEHGHVDITTANANATEMHGIRLVRRSACVSTLDCIYDRRNAATRQRHCSGLIVDCC